LILPFQLQRARPRTGQDKAETLIKMPSDCTTGTSVVPEALVAGHEPFILVWLPDRRGGYGDGDVR
jgi:hypothetical protein